MHPIIFFKFPLLSLVVLYESSVLVRDGGDCASATLCVLR